MPIPLYRPSIHKKDVAAVIRAISSGCLSRGNEVESFENEFARYVGKKYAVAVNSGTSGLHLMVRALGWRRGDEIITTPFSYIASSNALMYEGIKPIFVDIDPVTFNIDVNKLSASITKKTKGLLLVHIFGMPICYEECRKIIKKYKLQVIEDACEALGRPGSHFPVGRFGKGTVYGFFENKQLTSGGEGGMIVTDDEKVAICCRAMRDQGRSKKKNWIRHVVLGFNYRMTEMQAAIGRSQLNRLDIILAKRNKLAELYSRHLAGVANMTLPPNTFGKFRRSWFVYPVLFRNRAMRNRAAQLLAKYGVATSRLYFTPIPYFPMYRYVKADFHIAEDISRRILALPFFTDISARSVRRIASLLKKIQ